MATLSFGFTMRVPETEAATVDDLLAAHMTWMQKPLLMKKMVNSTPLNIMSKASELNDMMDPSKGTTIT